ncbi:MAG: hypothetical protein R2695_17450 [Acidimicrobiales bacterium]
MILPVHRFRAVVEADLLEIPARSATWPTVQPPQVTVAQLAAEEVGYAAGTLVPLAGSTTPAGFSDEYSHMFLATDLTEVPLDRQPRGGRT